MFKEFLFGLVIRMVPVLAIGILLWATVWPELSLGFFAIGAAASSSYFAYRDAKELTRY